MPNSSSSQLPFKPFKIKETLLQHNINSLQSRHVISGVLNIRAGNHNQPDKDSRPLECCGEFEGVNRFETFSDILTSFLAFPIDIHATPNNYPRDKQLNDIKGFFFQYLL